MLYSLIPKTYLKSRIICRPFFQAQTKHQVPNFDSNSRNLFSWQYYSKTWDLYHKNAVLVSRKTWLLLSVWDFVSQKGKEIPSYKKVVLWKKPHQQKYPISQISYFCICNLCWSSLYCLFSTTTRRGHNCQFWKNVVMLESKWKRDRFRHLQFHQTICKICSWFWFLTNHKILARISHTAWKVHKGIWATRLA